MSVGISDNINTPVSINVPGLVALSRYSRSLALKSSRIFALQGGNYQSTFKGRGMEYDESRLYQPGDDIRNLDWRITARSGKAYTKLFREERERPVFIWVDYRAPMFFATRGKYKSVIASETAALLAWSAAQYGDRVGGVIFSGQVHHEFKPRRGRSAVLYFIHQLVQHPAWQEEHTAVQDAQSGEKALLRLRRVVRPGSLVFLISDFRHFNEQARSHLINLSQHNEIVMLFVYDPLEQSLPPAGRYRLRDDQKEIEIETYNKSYRESYQQRFERHRLHLKKLARLNFIRYLECRTQDDPYLVLKQGLYTR